MYVYQERLARIDSEVAEEEERQREEAAYKKQRIDVAEQRRNAPVDDSKMVDEMFGFVDQSDLGGGYAPSAFKVSDCLCIGIFTRATLCLHDISCHLVLYLSLCVSVTSLCCVKTV